MKVDILLVFGHFRSVAAYLSIIRNLSPKVKIGVMRADVEPAYIAKTLSSHPMFLNLCAQFGAQIIAQGTEVDATLMVVQQFPYPAETAAVINRTVRAERRLGFLSLALAGIPLQDAFLTQFELTKVFVPNRRLFDFLVERRGAEAVYEGIEVQQVGLPYARYPVFPDFKADYVIASPTGFSFRKEVHKHQYFEDVLRLLEQIPSSAVVVYKAHNGLTRDYFTPTAYARPGALLSRIPRAREILSTFLARAPRWVRGHLERLYTSLLHAKVLNRATPITTMTPYSDISLEAFLPGVSKGVIGGLSNTIWGTLYFGLTYYNCADEEERNKSTINELLPHKDSSNYLDLNLQFFRVPYCHGDLSRGARGEEIVTAVDRNGDLMAAIMSELAPVRVGAHAQ
jgi:hypothetical protein